MKLPIIEFPPVPCY